MWFIIVKAVFRYNYKSVKKQLAVYNKMISLLNDDSNLLNFRQLNVSSQGFKVPVTYIQVNVQETF